MFILSDTEDIEVLSKRHNVLFLVGIIKCASD